MFFQFIQFAAAFLVLGGIGQAQAWGAVEGLSSMEADYFSQSRYTKLQVRVSPTVGSYPTRLDSALVYGGQVGVTYRPTRTTEYGLEVGYLKGSLDGALRSSRSLLRSGVTTELEVIPVTMTALYRLADGFVQPYVGFSFGIHSLSVSTSILPSITGWGIIAYVRPGIDFALTRNLGLFVEAKAGVVSGGFTLAPQLGINVGI